MLDNFFADPPGGCSNGDLNLYNTPPTSRNLSPLHMVPEDQSYNPVSLRNYDCDMYDNFASKNYINPNDMYINDYFNNDLDLDIPIDTPLQSDNEEGPTESVVTLDHPYCTSIHAKKQPKCPFFPIYIRKIECIKPKKPFRSIDCTKRKVLTLNNACYDEEGEFLTSPPSTSVYCDPGTEPVPGPSVFRGSAGESSSGEELSPRGSLPRAILRKKRGYTKVKFVDGFKRATHNEKERQRRGDLKNNLEFLRRTVPNVKHRPKASMVTVLLEATKHIYVCQAQELRYNSLKRKNEQLKKKKERLLLRH